MFNVGIIGAGTISVYHIESYNKLDECRVKAISDINRNLAEERAQKYFIDDVYTDYKELLQDKEIDAVSVATPTFTHKAIVIDALRAGKHVLCEKPPAMTADEVRECKRAAEEEGKLLMFAFVVRFFPFVQDVKKYIEDGKMGKPLMADCGRTARCFGSQGWFARRELGGGFLRDSAIHELDSTLYLMNYPRPVAVVANQTFANGDLFERLNGEKSFWASSDTNKYERNVESAIYGFITLDNGASITVKAAAILNLIEEGKWIELAGERAGVKIDFAPSDGKKLKFLEITEDFRHSEYAPDTKVGDVYYAEVSHFLDCCKNGRECMCKNEEAVILMEIIEALYKSAETGKPVVFEK